MPRSIFLSAWTILCLAAGSAMAPSATLAQPPALEKALLREKSDAGDQWTTELKLNLEGELYYRGPSKVVTRKLTAAAGHRFFERVLATDKLGSPTRVARYYQEAEATIKVRDDAVVRKLRPGVQLQVAQRIDDDTVVYAPAGPLTREELELTGEHFDVLMIAGLLPDHPVAVDESWEVELPVVQALAGLDGIIKGELKCTLKRLRPEKAEIVFAGNAHGIAHGAEVVVASIEGSITFDRTSDRIVQMSWKQEEKRGPGPASPESKTTAATTMTRSFAGRARELGDAVVGNIPEKPDPALLLLLYRDPEGRMQFLHDRSWHTVATTGETAVLRLLDRGELIAQLNVTPLPPAAAGKHISPAELARRAREAAGFTLTEVLQSDELPNKDGLWIYRHSVVGKAAEIDLQQNYYAVAGPKGHQALFVFTTEIDHAKTLGGKDLAIIGTVAFPDAK